MVEIPVIHPDSRYVLWGYLSINVMAQVTVKSLFAEPTYSTPPEMAVGGGDSADNKVS